MVYNFLSVTENPYKLSPQTVGSTSSSTTAKIASIQTTPKQNRFSVIGAGKKQPKRKPKRKAKKRRPVIKRPGKKAPPKRHGKKTSSKKRPKKFKKPIPGNKKISQTGKIAQPVAKRVDKPNTIYCGNLRDSKDHSSWLENDNFHVNCHAPKGRLQVSQSKTYANFKFLMNYLGMHD